MADSEPVAAFKQGLSNLLKNGSLTDLTLVCGSYRHKVHKAILCAHSDYFAAPSNFAEGVTNTLHLQGIGDGENDEACDDPEAVKLMISYFYDFDYSAPVIVDTSQPKAKGFGSVIVDTSQPKAKGFGSWFGRETPANRSCPPPTNGNRSAAPDGNMVMHARVFAAAVKYRVASLANLAADKFTAAVDMNWRHDSFAETVHIVYSTTPEDVRALRDVIMMTLHRQGDVLFKVDAVRQVVKKNKDLMFDLLCIRRGLDPSEHHRTFFKNAPIDSKTLLDAKFE
ncbi:hypothetical protein NU219Hw_g7121t1 [Hortaea werneckii]